MEINVQDVIDRLSGKLAKAETEKSIMEIQIETLRKENANLSAQIPRDTEVKSDPLEGEVIG